MIRMIGMHRSQKKEHKYRHYSNDTNLSEEIVFLFFFQRTKLSFEMLHQVVPIFCPDALVPVVWRRLVDPRGRSKALHPLGIRRHELTMAVAGVYGCDRASLRRRRAGLHARPTQVMVGGNAYKRMQREVC